MPNIALDPIDTPRSEADYWRHFNELLDSTKPDFRDIPLHNTFSYYKRRFNDFLTLYPKLEGEERAITQFDLRDIWHLIDAPLFEATVGLPQYVVVNILVLSLVDPQTYWSLYKRNFYQRTPLQQYTLLKTMTAWCKHNAFMPEGRCLYELQNTYGYQVTPLESEAFYQQARDLASGTSQILGGVPNARAKFNEALDYIYQMIRKQVKLKENYTLRDHIASGLWLRPTRTEIEYDAEVIIDGETFIISKNKALLLDEVTVDRLYDICVNKTKVQYWTFIKPEQGKQRVAERSDLPSHIKLDYVQTKLGEPWKRIFSMFTGFSSGRRLLFQMVMANFGGWRVPFDWDAMDHQPTGWMVLDMLQHDLDLLPDTDDWLKQNIMLSHENAECNITPPLERGKGEDHWIRVTNGVQSGSRDTSPWDSIFNLAIVLMALRLVQVTPLLLALVGDDTILHFKLRDDALAFVRGMAALKVIFSTSKFSISKLGSEFLRVWYTQGRAYGYLARGIGGLTQRKPWSNDPYGPASIAERQFAVITVMYRRGAPWPAIKLLAHAVRLTFSRINKISYDVLAIPPNMGGYGVDPFRVIFSTVIRKVEDLPVEYTPSTTWRRDHEQKRLEETYAITPTVPELNRTVEKQLHAILAFSGMPGTAGKLRELQVNSLEHARLLKGPTRYYEQRPGTIIDFQPVIALERFHDWGTRLADAAAYPSARDTILPPYYRTELMALTRKFGGRANAEAALTHTPPVKPPPLWVPELYEQLSRMFWAVAYGIAYQTQLSTTRLWYLLNSLDIQRTLDERLRFVYRP